MNDTMIIDPNEFAAALETTIGEIQNAIAARRAERDRLTAENAALAAQRDKLTAEIAERQKQLATEKQLEVLRSITALEFLQRAANTGADQMQLQALADSVAAVEPTEAEKTR